MRDRHIRYEADRDDPVDQFEREMQSVENSAKLLIGIVLVCVLVLCVMAVQQ